MKRNVVLLMVIISTTQSIVACGGFLAYLKKKWRIWNQDETMLVLSKLEVAQTNTDKEAVIDQIKNRRNYLIQNYQQQKMSKQEFDQEINILYARYVFSIDQDTIKKLFVDLEVAIKPLHENHTEIYFNNNKSTTLKKDT